MALQFLNDFGSENSETSLAADVLSYSQSNYNSASLPEYRLTRGNNGEGWQITLESKGLDKSTVCVKRHLMFEGVPYHKALRVNRFRRDAWRKYF